MVIEHIWERFGVVRRFVGRISGPDMANSAIAIQSHPRFDEIRYVLNDFSDCTGVDIDPDLVEEMAARAAIAARTLRSFRVAVVTTLPEVVAIAETFRRLAFADYPIREFDTMEAARAWLAS